MGVQKDMVPQKVPTEEPSDVAVEENKPLSEAKLDDFVVLGRYTLVLCCFSELLILSQLGNMFFMMYAGAAPTLVACGNASFSGYKDSKEACAALTNIQAETNCTPSFTTQFDSVNYEFGYYCSRTKLVKQSISIQMIGIMIGCIVFGWCSDNYGRKITMLGALAACMTCMVASSFTYDLLWFTILRFLVNFFNGGTMVILVPFMVENLPKQHRFWIQNLITWSPNIVVFALVAYLSHDWRTLTRASAVIALPAAAILIFLCESPRSLAQRRRLHEAKAAIQRIYRINGHKLDEEVLDQVLDKEAKKFQESTKKIKQYTMLHLFCTWRFTRYTVAVAFSLFVTSILNYSLLFNMEKLSGSIYLNSVFLGLFRYSLNLITAFSDIKLPWLGRKHVHFIADAFAAVALVIFVIVYIAGMQVELANVLRACVVGVIGICSLLYTTNGVCSSELFPTPIRNTSFSFGQLLSRLGVVFSPLIFFLGDIWTPLPYIVMLGLTVTDLCMFHAFTVETRGKPLPEHMPSKDKRIRLFRRGRRELLPQDDTAVPAPPKTELEAHPVP
ncbi:Protein Y51A2D.18 [Aphelenchoides avenae]|nr:Protein Y51A2D.18 [Aphelenchus avenae]